MRLEQLESTRPSEQIVGAVASINADAAVQTVWSSSASRNNATGRFLKVGGLDLGVFKGQAPRDDSTSRDILKSVQVAVPMMSAT